MGSGLDDAIAPLVDSLLGQMAAKDELWGLCHCRTGFLMYQRSYAHLHMFPVARGIGDLFITLLFDFLIRVF